MLNYTHKIVMYGKADILSCIHFKRENCIQLMMNKKKNKGSTNLEYSVEAAIDFYPYSGNYDLCYLYYRTIRV